MEEGWHLLGRKEVGMVGAKAWRRKGLVQGLFGVQRVNLFGWICMDGAEGWDKIRLER